MIIHHMADGSVRDSIDEIVIPRKFENVYKIVNSIRKKNQNGNHVKIEIVNK